MVDLKKNLETLEYNLKHETDQKKLRRIKDDIETLKIRIYGKGVVEQNVPNNLVNGHFNDQKPKYRNVAHNRR